MSEEQKQCTCMENGEQCTLRAMVVYHHAYGVTLFCEHHFRLWLDYWIKKGYSVAAD